MIKINVYDFDKTIYDGDSTLDFYFYCVKEDISLVRFLPTQIMGFILYKLNLKNKEYFKEKFFSFLNGIKNIDEYILGFWGKNENKIKMWLINNKDNIVIISASPEFLLKSICNKMGVKKLIASKVDKKSGKFFSKNCYGLEKLNRLKIEFTSFEIDEFYSDSISDKYLADISKNSYLIKGDLISKWK